jgi:hypothetical protein
LAYSFLVNGWIAKPSSFRGGTGRKVLLACHGRRSFSEKQARSDTGKGIGRVRDVQTSRKIMRIPLFRFCLVLLFALGRCRSLTLFTDTTVLSHDHFGNYGGFVLPKDREPPYTYYVAQARLGLAEMQNAGLAIERLGQVTKVSAH